MCGGRHTSKGTLRDCGPAQVPPSRVPRVKFPPGRLECSYSEPKAMWARPQPSGWGPEVPRETANPKMLKRRSLNHSHPLPLDYQFVLVLTSERLYGIVASQRIDPQWPYSHIFRRAAGLTQFVQPGASRPRSICPSYILRFFEGPAARLRGLNTTLWARQRASIKWQFPPEAVVGREQAARGI